MKKITGMCTLVLACSTVALFAQEGLVMPAPPVLVIQREFTKPGREGMHGKSESKFAAAFRADKQPVHYVAATSMSGRARALFLLGFGSFAEWEKETVALEKSGLLEKLGPVMVADGDLLSEYSQSVFVLDKEHSLRLEGDAVHARYFEITQFHVKPGHRREFLEVAKMYRDGFMKTDSKAHWAMYESYYGEKNGGYYIAISPVKSLAEDDEGMKDDEKFAAAMGSEGMKKIAEMTASCLESTESNLFEVDAKMSYAADEWIKADPFWKPTASATPAKKAAAPAGQ
jgi:hypothetical protein